MSQDSLGCQLLIRQFEPGDQQAARQLIVEGLGEHWGFIDETLNPDIDDITKHYIEAGAVFVVVERGPMLVGTGALISEGAAVGRLVRVSVTRPFRRMGISRAIVARLLSESRTRGYRLLLVETTVHWHEAIELYRRCGFVEYRHDGENAYLRRRLP